MTNALKKQGKFGAARMIENQAGHPAPLSIRAGSGRPATPPGGVRRENSLPLAERPFCLSRSEGVKK